VPIEDDPGRAPPMPTSAACHIASPLQAASGAVEATILSGPNQYEALRSTDRVPQRAGRDVMAGKFELYKDKSGKFRFRLKSSNGQVIATGEAYETKASALNGIESVKKNSAGAKTDDQTD